MSAPISAQSIQLLFGSDLGYGWSETYWNIGSPKNSIDAQMTALINGRASILTNGAAINYVRMQTTFSRSPLLLNPSPSGTVTGQAGAEGPDFVCIDLRLTGVFGGIGRFFLRGIPQAEYDGDQINFDPAYNAAFQTYLDALVNPGVFAIKTSTVTAPRPMYPAQALTPLQPRGYSFTTATNPGLVVGSTIRMHQAQTVGYNGVKQVTSVSGAAPALIFVGGAAPDRKSVV